MFARPLLLYLILLICLSSITFAFDPISESSTTLLAVSDFENGTLFGGTAKLTLEIVPGKGRVFLDTFPLTKVDTQVSARTAKQIACDFLDLDCSELDFIYTIESGSSIIGGPSAGAAMTALTITTLDDVNIAKNIALTGTINPGAIVGSVGGVKEKITAAQKRGLKVALIPQGSRFQPIKQNETNQSEPALISETLETEDLVLYGESIGISVFEVAHIYDVLNHYAPGVYEVTNSTITIPTYYEETMGDIAISMCERSNEVLSQLTEFNKTVNGVQFEIINGVLHSSGDVVLENTSIDINQTYVTSKDLNEYGHSAIEFKQFYAAASYCYGSTLNANFLVNIDENVSEYAKYATEYVSKNQPDISKYETVTDLQTFMLVEERIAEAKDLLDRGDTQLENNNSYDALNSYLTAVERVNSANQWSKFAKNFGTEYEINNGLLRSACEQRVQETQERYNYLLLYYPFASQFDERLEEIRADLAKGNYEVCLHQVALTKAEVDVVLSSSGLGEDSVLNTVIQRTEIVEQIILDQIEKQNFPLVGYSYLEYAKSLSQTDPQSSLLYLQYAVELSQIDLFFEKNGHAKPFDGDTATVNRNETFQLEKEHALSFVIGAFLVISFFALCGCIRAHKAKDKTKTKKVKK